MVCFLLIVLYTHIECKIDYLTFNFAFYGPVMNQQSLFKPLHYRHYLYILPQVSVGT